MRHPARARAPRRRLLLRPSADDGSCRARRRRPPICPPDGAARLRALVAEIEKTFPKLVELYDNTASLQDRTVSTGILTPALAQQFGAGGHVGRASGRNFDSRRTPGYPPYDALEFSVPVLEEGDVDARVWIRIKEVEQSLSLIKQMLDQLPAGPISVDFSSAGRQRWRRRRAGRGVPRRRSRLGPDCGRKS